MSTPPDPDRVTALVETLNQEQVECILVFDMLLDPFGNERVPTPLGRAVMDRVREAGR